MPNLNWDQFSAPAEGAGPSAWDRFSAPAEGKPKGVIEKAIEPITSYPETYSGMQRDARSLMSEGIEQARQGTVSDAAIGAGKTALGGLGFVTSPVNAALRTVVGKPVEENTGIPKEYTEFAASLALPIPKRIPTMSKAKPAAPAAEELFNAADKGYAAARASDFTAAPEQMAELSANLTSKLKDAGYRDFLTPKTFRALQELKTDGPSNVSDIDAVRRALNIAAKDPAESDAARRATQEIDKFLSPQVPEIASARADYAAASRREAADQAAERASNNSSAAHSGQNYDNAVRQQFRAIINSPKARRGFSEDELAQMQRVVDGTSVGNAARFTGGMLGGGGGLTSAVTAIASGGIAPAIGFVLKKLGNAITAGEVTKLQELVSSRSPLARQIGSPLQAWGEAAKDIEVSATPRNIARLSIASRNLSNNLRDVGVTVSPDDLMRTLQGPMRSAADQEQP